MAENSNGWTAEIRRVDQRFEDLRETQRREGELLEKQLAEYKATISSKLSEMNEVRRQIYEERGQYQLREKSDALYNALFDRLSRLEKEQSAFTGRLIGMGASLLFFISLFEIGLKFWK